MEGEVCDLDNGDQKGAGLESGIGEDPEEGQRL